MNITLPETPWNTKPTPTREHTQPQPERRLSSGQFGILPRSARILIATPPRREAMLEHEEAMIQNALAYRVRASEKLCKRTQMFERIRIVRDFDLSIEAACEAFKVETELAEYYIIKAREGTE